MSCGHWFEGFLRIGQLKKLNTKTQTHNGNSKQHTENNKNVKQQPHHSR